jgi:hypothetical protein
MNSTSHLFVVAVAFGSIAQAGLGQSIVVNGSFESYGGPGNSNIGMGLDGWTIGGPAGIDIVIPESGPGFYFSPADGDVSLSLNWAGPSSITQALVTDPGQLYEVRFFMAAEVFGGPQWRTMDVTWNGVTIGSPAFEYTGQGPDDMGWTEFVYTAMGTGDDALSFVSTTDANYGPALDLVSVIPVPSPATLPVMAVLGFGVMRRRRA